jgi:hypothetical protein
LKIISIISGALCILALVFIVWFVRDLYIVPAVDSVAFFESTTQLQQLFFDEGQELNEQHNEQDTKQDTMRVVYFWQNHCPCDQFTKPHFLLLLNQYRHLASNIVFYLAPVDNSSVTHEVKDVQQLPKALLDRVRADVKATPSVGIWDSNGQLVYFGPHSLGYVCNNDTSLVKKVLDALLNKQTVSSGGVMGEGCFCPVN